MRHGVVKCRGTEDRGGLVMVSSRPLHGHIWYRSEGKWTGVKTRMKGSL